MYNHHTQAKSVCTVPQICTRVPLLRCNFFIASETGKKSSCLAFIAHTKAQQCMLSTGTAKSLCCGWNRKKKAPKSSVKCRVRQSVGQGSAAEPKHLSLFRMLLRSSKKLEASVLLQHPQQERFSQPQERVVVVTSTAFLSTCMCIRASPVHV